MKKAIYDYYTKTLVNPNNKQSIPGAEVNAQIEELRELLAQKFNWKDRGHIVFFPNAYYAKKNLLHFLFNGQPFKELKFFSNSKERDGYILETEEKLKVSYVKAWKGVKAKHFAVFASDSIGEPKDRPSGTINGQYLFIETFMDDVDVRGADAFIFNVIEGVAVVGFRKEMNLEPMFLGSNSASFADEKTYVLSGDFRRVECGTQNVPLLLAIRSFYKSQ